MKYLNWTLLFIAAIALFLTAITANAECQTSESAETVEDQMVINTDVPAHLQGKTYLICDANGQNCSRPVSTSTHKLVPRQQQFIVTKTKQHSATLCAADKEKNRISLLAGNGARAGLNTTRSGDEVSVESRVGTVLGLQYQRETDWKLFGMPVSGLGQVQDNKTGLLGVGLGW